MQDVVTEIELNAKAFKAPAPIQMLPGHANEEGLARNMAPPTWGHVEVVNKNKEGEIIAILVAQNAKELTAEGRDPACHVPGFLNLGCMPEQTVIHGTFGDGVTSLQIALYYGSKYKTIDKARSGNVKDNFEFLKVYQCRCRGKNVLLKYKGGSLELQKGQAEGPLSVMGKKRSLGGGIDMKTNVDSLHLIADVSSG
eukprot:CAMPEP_0174700998 /NCGR_PEP_ID=MMETSP1094-20130205/5778_1 /TAXON_ID=156173 /ORGANISM="Chrysochromulina brevifilum, Strain UTEX LB 985" /LENGTH=196 /DNA_ID=CAMNT_0015898573 /DNA_START=42 /DNA_END=632 /DNA_ORIENTATION=-